MIDAVLKNSVRVVPGMFREAFMTVCGAWLVLTGVPAQAQIPAADLAASSQCKNLAAGRKTAPNRSNWFYSKMGARTQPCWPMSR